MTVVNLLLAAPHTTEETPPSLLDAVAEQPVAVRPDPRDAEIRQLRALVQGMERELFFLRQREAIPRYGLAYYQVGVDWAAGWAPNQTATMIRRDPTTSRRICVCGNWRCETGPFVEVR